MRKTLYIYVLKRIPQYGFEIGIQQGASGYQLQDRKNRSSGASALGPNARLYGHCFLYTTPDKSGN